MKRCVLLLLAVLFTFGVYAQGETEVLPLPDSLARTLKEHRKTDMARAEALDAAIMFYHDRRRVKDASVYIHELSFLADDLKDNYWIATSNYYSALCDLENKDYSKAIVKLDNALECVETLRFTDRTRLLTGRIYLAESSYYKAMNMFPESYEVIQKGLDVLDETQITVRSRLLNNLGNIHQEMNNYNECIEVINEALRGEKRSIYYENIALAYIGKECYDSALLYTDSALFYSSSLFDSLVAMHSKGIIFGTSGDLEAAEKLYDECLAKTKYNSSFSNLNSFLYQNYAGIAAKKGNFQKAIQLADDAIGISRALQDDNRLAECMKLKSQILYSMRDYESSILCMMKYDSLCEVLKMNQNRDKVYETMHRHEMSMMKQKYETEKRIEKQRQQYFVVIAALIAILAVIIALLLSRIKKQKEAILKQELDLRNREVTSKTMSQMQTNEVLNEVIEKLTRLANDPKGSSAPLPMVIRELKSRVDDGAKTDFDYYFVQVHPDFYAHLKKDHPDLSQNELRLCALIRAKLNIKEIANLNNVSIDSVKSSRKRLRKSLGINDSNVDLVEYLSNY